jgi:molybdenum cofactor cytidylyltransferase
VLKHGVSEGGCCGILLAAGRSTRFGADKLLHTLADGTSIALASAKPMKAVLRRVVAVVDPRNAALCRLLESAGVEIVAAPTADEGMGKSLAAGVAATSGSAGWIVALADMPFIASATVARLLSALQAGAAVAAPTYQGRRGHPVGFDRRFRDELLAMRGDEGARHIVAAHRDGLRLIEVDDPGVLRDIDTPEDLRQ